jgi:Rho-type GTPase-activating protein 1/2
MTARNLAVVFGPTVMRPVDIQREAREAQNQVNALEFLLGNYKTIFGSD